MAAPARRGEAWRHFCMGARNSAGRHRTARQLKHIEPTNALTPFFSNTALPGSAARRLLLVSYHFPPDTGAGALRWQKLAGHLASRGWELDVVTQHPSSVSGADPSRLADLPAGTRVWGIQPPLLLGDRIEARLWTLYRRIRPARILDEADVLEAAASPANGPSDRCARDEVRKWRRLLFEPQVAYHAWRLWQWEAAWAARAGAVARRILDPSQHQAVVTCGPPHMVHEAGRRVAAGARLPLVVDMRDPWSLVQRLPPTIASPLWYSIAERYERRVLQAASLVVTNTEPAMEAMQRRYPEHAAGIITVTNGYDDDPVPAAAERSRFVIAYAGTIYLDRDPRLLLRAARRVVAELGLEPGEFAVEMMGHVQSYDGVTLQAMAAEEGLQGFVHLHPRGSRTDALRFLAGASMLVSLPQDSDMAIPSKIFEYMQFQAWLLAMAEPWSATARLLGETGADVLRPGDVDGLTQAIRTRFLQFRAGARPEPIAGDTRFSRRAQAAILVRAIEEATHSKAPERRWPARERPAPVAG